MIFEEQFEELMERTRNLTDAPDCEPERQAYYVERCRNIIMSETIKRGKPLTFHSTCIGCQMNAKDSEKLTGLLTMIGYREIEDEDSADFVIYNTCTVRENANQKVYGRLGQLGSRKKNNPDMIIALCGCMMQEAEVVETIKNKYRFVDLIFGTHNIYKLAELLYRCLCRTIQDRQPVVDIWEDSHGIVEMIPAKRVYPFKSGVNIMFGCNNFCSYCIVPYVRGRERSREAKDIVEEVRRLADDGVIEVMLLGQNVNSYGKGLKEPVSFAELLRMVCSVEKIQRVRFMTSHPKDLSEDLIEVMATEPKICHHLHLPLQSGSTELLKVMNRHYTKEDYLDLVKRIRERIPDLSLTTDIIVGFPGETEADFEDTLDVVRKAQYDSAFTFVYSKRSGTPAAVMENQVDSETVHRRFDRLLSLVQEIASERCGIDCGKTLPALVEDIDSHEEGYVTGRLGNNIMVHFKGSSDLIGSIVNVKLEEAHGFYYMGTMVD